MNLSSYLGNKRQTSFFHSTIIILLIVICSIQNVPWYAIMTLSIIQIFLYGAVGEKSSRVTAIIAFILLFLGFKGALSSGHIPRLYEVELLHLFLILQGTSYMIHLHDIQEERKEKNRDKLKRNNEILEQIKQLQKLSNENTAFYNSCQTEPSIKSTPTGGTLKRQ